MILDITVVPGSGSFRIVRKDGQIKVFLKSKAEDNKANIELIKKLKKELKCGVCIVSGMKSRQKKIELDIEPEKFAELKF